MTYPSIAASGVLNSCEIFVTKSFLNDSILPSSCTILLKLSVSSLSSRRDLPVSTLMEKSPFDTCLALAEITQGDENLKPQHQRYDKTDKNTAEKKYKAREQRIKLKKADFSLLAVCDEIHQETGHQRHYGQYDKTEYQHIKPVT